MRAREDDVRRWHYIHANKRTSTPTACLFVDTETTGLPIAGNPHSTLQVLRLWCARYCRIDKGYVRSTNIYTGNDHWSFWQLVCKFMNPKRPLWLFAHNIGFDLTVLRFWEMLEDNKFTFDDVNVVSHNAAEGHKKTKWRGFAVLDDPPTILECRCTTEPGVLICNDTYNYFRTSVAKLGESVGLPKLEMPGESASDEELIVYCQRDVHIIYRAVTDLMRFVVDQDIGMWSYTAPAQAMRAYRHRFMKHKILVHGNKDALSLEREAYYGGRLENHYIGKVFSKDDSTRYYYANDGAMHFGGREGPIYVLDINSCYPAMMLWHSYPCAIIDSIVCDSQRCVYMDFSQYCMIGIVLIQSNNELFPVRRNGKTLMASGKFTTTLCGPELKRAYYRGCIKWIGVLLRYKPADLFSEYVSFFWNLRTAYREVGDTVRESWCKIMLNSLSGKFGQRARKWDNVDDVDAPFPWGLWSTRDTIKHESRCYRSLAWAVQQESDAGESIDSCPAISAYITSYAREYINDIIRICGYDNVYYVDTDCIHVNQEGMDRCNNSGLVHESSIGKLSVRGIYQSAEYRGLKDYSLDDLHIISGVKASAELVQKGLFRQDKFHKLRSILSSTPPPGVRVDRVTIDRRNGLDPQRIQPDGRVLPQVVVD